jgi:hypothetical protein
MTKTWEVPKLDTKTIFKILELRKWFISTIPKVGRRITT